MKNDSRDPADSTSDDLIRNLYFAQFLEETGKDDMALKEYKKVLENDGGSLDALLGAGKIHYRNADFPESLKFLEEAVNVDPTSAVGWYYLSRTYLELDRPDQARESYRNAVDLDAQYEDPDLEMELFQKEKVSVTTETAGDGLFFEAECSMLTFDDVGGLEELKENIRMNIIYPFQQPDLYKAYGKKVGGGILLYGPPGCGKTYIAKATAGECNARFINVGIEDVLDMWLGESEKKLHNLFEEARDLAPTVLFFDEMEAIGRSRSKTGSESLSVLVNQFLAEMDGIESNNEDILIMGATNAPWNIDPAFIRPGRFDRVIFVPPPDLKARIEILKIKTRDKPVQQLDYLKIAKTMKRTSGADIDAVYDCAAEDGLKEALKTGKVKHLTTQDFLNAVKKVRPSTVEWLESARNYATYSNQSGMYNDIIEYLKKED